jgi:hypothetical protein
MKAKSVLYLVLILGLLAPMSAFPALAEEGDVPMWVHQMRVTYTGRSHWGPDAIEALVHMRDDNLDSVACALVDAVWTLPDGTTYLQTGVETNIQGIAEFSIFEGAGDYTICVTGATKEGWEYDSDSNWETCATFIMPPYQPVE